MKLLQHPILQYIFNGLPREEMLWLLFPGKHMALLSTRRATMMKCVFMQQVLISISCQAGSHYPLDLQCPPGLQ